MLQADNVGFRYHAASPLVVDGVTLAIGSGDLVGVLAPAGLPNVVIRDFALGLDGREIKVFMPSAWSKTGNGRTHVGPRRVALPKPIRANGMEISHTDTDEGTAETEQLKQTIRDAWAYAATVKDGPYNVEIPLSSGK